MSRELQSDERAADDACYLPEWFAFSFKITATLIISYYCFTTIGLKLPVGLSIKMWNCKSVCHNWGVGRLQKLYKSSKTMQLEWRQMSVKTSQCTRLSTICWAVYSGWHLSSASLTLFEGNLTKGQKWGKHFHVMTSSWCSLGECRIRLNHMEGINTLRPRQNGRHFPDDSFKRIFLNENVWISIEVSLKFLPKGPINNIPALDR